MTAPTTNHHAPDTFGAFLCQEETMETYYTNAEEDICECSESYRHRGEHTPGCPADNGERGELEP